MGARSFLFLSGPSKCHPPLRPSSTLSPACPIAHAFLGLRKVDPSGPLLIPPSFACMIVMKRRLAAKEHNRQRAQRVAVRDHNLEEFCLVLLVRCLLALLYIRNEVLVIDAIGSLCKGLVYCSSDHRHC